MGFWIFCLAMNLLLPVIMLVFGRLFQTKPPKPSTACSATAPPDP